MGFYAIKSSKSSTNKRNTTERNDKMKITHEHYAELKARIATIWTPEKNDAHRTFIINEGKSKDVEKRLRWDWSYYAKMSPWMCDNLYTYLDDTHIDTALKQVMRDLVAN